MKEIILTTKKNKMQQIIILDESTGGVLITDYDPNIWEDPEDMEDEFGNALIHSSCSYMIVNKLILRIE